MESRKNNEVAKPRIPRKKAPVATFQQKQHVYRSASSSSTDFVLTDERVVCLMAVTKCYYAVTPKKALEIDDS